jgi:hypothetical protein
MTFVPLSPQDQTVSLIRFGRIFATRVMHIRQRTLTCIGSGAMGVVSPADG